MRRRSLMTSQDCDRDARFLLAALRHLGIGPEDEEAFNASYEAGDPQQRSLYEDGWRGALILSFASRPEIREMARAELTIRAGNLGPVAEAYAADSEICREIMKVIAPLPDAARLSLVGELASAASSNPAALTLLAAARQDTHGATAGEAVMAWTDACLAQNAFGDREREFLAGELHALGPEYQQRRAGALVGLIATGNIQIFANLKNHEGRPEDIGVGRIFSLEESDRYLRRVLIHWDDVASGLGGEEKALVRLDLSPHRTLKILHPGTPSAQRLFELLEARAADVPAAPFDERLAAMRRFAPNSAQMRKLIEPLLLQRGSTRDWRRSNAERWPGMIAAEIFAEHFAQSDLRRSVIEVFTADPTSDCAAAALAETLLRERDAALASLLREKAPGIRYEMVTTLRMTAALGDIVGALEWLLKNDPKEALGWNCPFWVPAFLRRIERDDGAADALIAALGDAPSASARLSELALLGLGCKDKAKTRPILVGALRDYEAAPAPVIAFDVTAGAYRLAVHVLQALLS
jgi:hypothetical protein